MLKEIIILIILSTSVSANIYTEINDKAIELRKNNTIDTIKAIDEYIETTTHYQYSKYPVGLFNFWKNRVGDCTDKAYLKRELLKDLNISNRLVHGIVLTREGYERHDWVEVRLNNTWFSLETDYFKLVKKYGNGVW